MRRLLTLLLGAVLALGLVSRAQALEVRQDESVLVAEGETVNDDLLAVGTLVRVDGRVRGDLYVFGQFVSVTGTVDGDVIGAAPQIEVNGTVGGNLRVVGGNVTTGAAVGRNVLAAARSFLIFRGARVNGSVTALTQRFGVEGPVGRALTLAATDAVVDAPVGDLQAAAGTLRFAPNARVGDVEYWSEADAVVQPGAVLGRVIRHEGPRLEIGVELRRAAARVARILSIAWLIGTLIVGALLAALVPRLPGIAADDMVRRPLRTLALGLAALAVTPIGALLAALTLIGLPIAFLAGGLWVLGVFVGWLVVATGLAEVARRWLRRDGRWTNLHPSLLSVVGLLALWLVAQVPVLGGLVVFVVLCLGLGVLVGRLWPALRAPASPVPRAPVEPATPAVETRPPTL